MDPLLAAANAALDDGRAADAIKHLTAAVAINPKRPVLVYKILAVQLYQQGRFQEGAACTRRGLEFYPNDFHLWNIRGAMLRKLRRLPEALEALDRARTIDPADLGARNNRANVLLDLGRGEAAAAAFAELAASNPDSADLQRQLSRSLVLQGKRDEAMAHLARAIQLNPAFLNAWLDRIGILIEDYRTDEAEQEIETALAAIPGADRLLEARAVTMRRAGQIGAAAAYLEGLLPTHSDAAWLHYQLGRTLQDTDAARTLSYIRRAVALEPSNLEYTMALIEALEHGRNESLDEAMRLAVEVLPRKAFFQPSHLTILQRLFVRVLAFDRMRDLADFKTLGRAWAGMDLHTALLNQFSRITGDEDRYELLEQHRIWGREAERRADANPISRPARAARGGKVRLGFMSSDLRRHPVGYFTEPLFDHIDRERFEVFVYSYFQGEQDALQAHTAEQITGFRWWPDISARDAAQAIADDDLDLLIELGGSTAMNKLEVMAYRPAARQASWLGYPHSTGLSAIDYLILDPHVRPERDDLMLETPLLMPTSWIALGPRAFPESHVIEPGRPAERRGFVTFGTANNSYKYTPQAFDAWAAILARTPGSRFMILRPEGGCSTFRSNATRHFVERGIEADRVEFATEQPHMLGYNRIDITLDTFPQTGGTTTCEALWMGVPTVSLVGPTIYERLSYSILVNAGLEDLCVRTVDAYVEKAVHLAGDTDRLADIRANQRARLKASPLGRTEEFARDFYDMIARVMADPFTPKN